jgi:HAD superfamily hydrolase (TIGR01509 family)
MSIAAVIFDMDGLMLDTERIALRVWRQAAHDLGFALDEPIARRMVGRNTAANRALLIDHFGQGFPFDELATLAASRYRAELDAGGVPRKPGLLELLEFLSSRRVPLAVATSTATALAMRKLDQAAVRRFFPVVIGGDDVTRGKPAPDVFLLAAARLGQDPRRCAVLEDSGPGIEAAHAAGMVPILVPDGRAPEEASRRFAAFVVESLAAAQPLLERLLAIEPG